MIAHLEVGEQAGLAEVVAAGSGQRLGQDALAQRAGELPHCALVLICLPCHHRNAQSHAQAPRQAYMAGSGREARSIARLRGVFD